MLAFAPNGEELKSEYHMTGKMLVRLVTSDGNFDYEITVDLKIDDIPF